MDRAQHYLLKSFSTIFASLFFTLFFIASIVFFIKISIITSVITINFIELLMMYVYLLPNILIYTIPITFFIALCLSLFQLSKENETIVLFTLGYNPKKIATLFVFVSMLISALLILNTLVLIPRAKQLNANFIDYKRTEAKFNIKATEFGQKFSDWLVYIDASDEKDSFKNIVMYQEKTSEAKQNIITSQNAALQNDQGVLKLELGDGKAYEISSAKIEQVNFEKMLIRSDGGNSFSPVLDIFSYWLEALKNEKRANDLAFFLLIALFPLTTVLFGLGLGIVTHRYDKSRINTSIVFVVGSYMLPSIILVQYIGLYTLLITPPLTLLFSYMFYKKKIILRY